ncbi:MAG: hypothetical protein AAF441_02770 [Pseudomonadota bacterium]
MPIKNPLAYTVTCLRLVIAITTIFWLLSGNWLWGAVGIACTAISHLPAVVIPQSRLRPACELCVSALLSAHVALGMQADFYETSAVYDKLIHAAGFGAITAIVISALSRYRDVHAPNLKPAALAFAAIGIAVSLGTAWEIFEFSLDRTGLFQTQRGLNDTMLDLIADVVGALAVVGAHAVFNGLRPRLAA